MQTTLQELLALLNESAKVRLAFTSVINLAGGACEADCVIKYISEKTVVADVITFASQDITTNVKAMLALAEARKEEIALASQDSADAEEAAKSCTNAITFVDSHLRYLKYIELSSGHRIQFGSAGPTPRELSALIGVR
jgi:hypothetical protein